MTKIIDISTGATLEDDGASEGVNEGVIEGEEEQLKNKVLEDLLAEFSKYSNQLSMNEKITDKEYHLLAQGIFGCKEIAKKVFELHGL